MVASADGKAAISGKSAPLSSEADRELFHALRLRFDAVMAGAGTIRAERYGRIVKDPEARAQRERDGLDPDPIAIVVSASGDVPRDIGLFEEPEQRVEIAANLDEVREICTKEGIRSVLCEGGPRLNASLLETDMVDELFLAVAPLLAGGEAKTIVEGVPLAAPEGLGLITVHEADGHLFLRYRRR